MQRLMKASGLSYTMHSAGTTVGMSFPVVYVRVNPVYSVFCPTLTSGLKLEHEVLRWSRSVAPNMHIIQIYFAYITTQL